MAEARLLAHKKSESKLLSNIELHALQQFTESQHTGRSLYAPSVSNRPPLHATSQSCTVQVQRRRDRHARVGQRSVFGQPLAIAAQRTNRVAKQRRQMLAHGSHAVVGRQAKDTQRPVKRILHEHLNGRSSVCYSTAPTTKCEHQTETRVPP